MKTTTARVHAMSGIDARTAPATEALATLATMIGCKLANLWVKENGFVALWTYQCAGEIVGRIVPMEVAL